MSSPKTRWQLNDEKQQAYKVKDENLEMGWGSRLNKLHDKDGRVANKFGDLADRRLDEQEPAPIESAPKPRRIGSTILDPETERLRQAAADSRQAVKDQKARANRDNSIASSISQQDFESIYVGWCKRHPEFYASEWNLQNLVAILLTALVRGSTETTGLNSASLEVCYQWAVKQSPPLFESAPGQRRRGEPAARKVNFEPQVKEETVTNQRVIQRTVVTRAENQALRAKPFEQLQAEARAMNKGAK